MRNVGSRGSWPSGSNTVFYKNRYGDFEVNISRRLNPYRTSYLAELVGCTPQTISNWRAGQIPQKGSHEFLRGLFKMTPRRFEQLVERSRSDSPR